MKKNLFSITMQIAILVIGLSLSILLGAKNIPFSMVPIIFSVLVLGFMKLFLHRENNFSVKKKFLLKGGGEILLIQVKREIPIEAICASEGFDFFSQNEFDDIVVPLFKENIEIFLRKKIIFFLGGLYSPRVISFEPLALETNNNLKIIQKNSFLIIKN